MSISHIRIWLNVVSYNNGGNYKLVRKIKIETIINKSCFDFKKKV